ncbi:MAG: prolipoprotein diacylglyceryl transferase [Tindallia sp. MSAO_Bac2]|nr:MAG: prolipoprotein diacylglyceryl transferase [Tindallia sp. MSAO_Bac2]
MNRIAFTVFGIEVAWYGLLVATGMLLGVLLAQKRAIDEGFGEEAIFDIAIWAIPFGVLGARLYYILFNWNYYVSEPMRMLQFREGGLAIHGGIILGFIVGYLVCRRKGLPFWNMADITAPSFILGQAIGRWGNYFNQEAYGRPTDLPWAITVNEVQVHPTFLYESIWNILVMFFLLYYTPKKKVDGEVFWLYLILYSVGRFFIEGLRTDSLMIGPFRTAQLISVAMIIGGLLAIKLFRLRESNKN